MISRLVVLLITIVLLSGFLLAGCGRGGGGGRSPAARATQTAEAVLAQTVVPTPSSTSTPTSTPTPTATLTPSPTDSPTTTPSTTTTTTPTPTATQVAPSPSGFQVYFIDVGQGDATLIISDTGESLLIDGGRSKTRINDRLNTLGITDLDAVLATHSDADHIAGLVEVFSLFEVERFYWNGQLHDTQTFQNLMSAVGSEGSVTTVSRSGDTIPLGSLTLQVLHPASLSGDSNVDSIVVLVSCGSMQVLLTGDAEIPSEQDMLSAGILVDIDVLKVGHHGSRTSTSEEFLTALVPEVGLISAGLTSQFGHPHQEVVDRLLGAGVDLYHTDTTDQDDTILMTSDCQSVGFARADARSVSLDPWMSPSETSEPTPTPTPSATVPTTPTTRQPLVGDVLINEFLPNPSTGNEWIELYNTSSDFLDVSGMWLDDIASGGSSPRQISASTVVAPGGYYVHDMGGAYLNNGGDDVRLLSADQSTIFDSFSYSSTQKGVSYCRLPDGGAWSSTCAPSIIAEN